MDPSQNEVPTFRERPTEEKRTKLSKLLEKNPNKIPLIFEKHPLSKLNVDKNMKFISTRNIKLAHFSKQIREMINLSADSSIFFSCKNLKVIKHDILVGDLYDQYKDEDGFLYVQFREVESFGK